MGKAALAVVGIFALLVGFLFLSLFFSQNWGLIGFAVDPSVEGCEQEWTCGEWSSCDGGLQRRSCYDVRECASRQARGEVVTLITVEKPAEQRSCTETIVVSTGGMPLARYLPDAVAAVSWSTLFLVILALFAFFIMILLLWYSSSGQRLRRRLKKVERRWEHFSIDLLKKEYFVLCRLYLRSSERHKRNHYARLMKIRQTLHDYLRADQQLQHLLKRANEGTYEEQRKRYALIYKLYTQLPPRVQEQYHTHLLQLRDRLERRDMQ